MATPFFTPALEDIGPPEGPSQDAAPAGQYPDELAPFWGFICLVSWLASLDQGNFFPADQAQRPSSNALDQLVEDEKSAVESAHEDDDDVLLPYGAFKLIVESCSKADPDAPAFGFHQPLHEPFTEKTALAPYLADLNSEDEAPLLPYLAFVALAHLLFHPAATTSSCWRPSPTGRPRRSARGRRARRRTWRASPARSSSAATRSAPCACARRSELLPITLTPRT